MYIIEARELVALEPSRMPHAFVRLNFADQELRTRTIPSMQTPQWNDVFHLYLASTKE